MSARMRVLCSVLVGVTAVGCSGPERAGGAPGPVIDDPAVATPAVPTPAVPPSTAGPAPSPAPAAPGPTSRATTRPRESSRPTPRPRPSSASPQSRPGGAPAPGGTGGNGTGPTSDGPTPPPAPPTPPPAPPTPPPAPPTPPPVRPGGAPKGAAIVEQVDSGDDYNQFVAAQLVRCEPEGRPGCWDFERRGGAATDRVCGVSPSSGSFAEYGTTIVITVKPGPIDTSCDELGTAPSDTAAGS